MMPHIHLQVTFPSVLLLALSLVQYTFIISTSAFIPSRQYKYPAIHQHSTLRHDDTIFRSQPLHLSASTPLDLAESTLPSVALILPVGVRNTTARGSGFVIDVPSVTKGVDGNDSIIYLLTAAHVVLPGYQIQVIFYPKNDYSWVKSSAIVIGRDVESDLALLQVNITESQFTATTLPKPLVLSNLTKANIGTPAYAMGYPSGGVVGPAMTSGIVCGNALGLATSVSAEILQDRVTKGTDEPDYNIDDDTEKEITQYVVTDAAMAGGMSGGPLVDGNTGHVLGLNALHNMELRALGNYAVSAAECIEFLNNQNIESIENDGRSNKQEPATYQVVLYNDRFNKRARVQSLLENIAMLNSTVSNKAMMDAHTKGRGVVKEFFRDDAEARELCDALRKEDLLVEMETVR